MEKQYPEAFQVHHGVVRKAVLQKYPFSVFYEYRPGEVRSLAVAHHKPKPNYWDERS